MKITVETETGALTLSTTISNTVEFVETLYNILPITTHHPDNIDNILLELIENRKKSIAD